MSDIIKIEHLNKCFGDVKAVNDLSFRVKKGELFAFLGVNGAYKTIRITGVIIDENNIPLSLKKSFLFLLTSAVISFITDHLPIFSQSQQEIHHPYRLLLPHNP